MFFDEMAALADRHGGPHGLRGILKETKVFNFIGMDSKPLYSKDIGEDGGKVVMSDGYNLSEGTGVIEVNDLFDLELPFDYVTIEDRIGASDDPDDSLNLTLWKTTTELPEYKKGWDFMYAIPLGEHFGSRTYILVYGTTTINRLSGRMANTVRKFACMTNRGGLAHSFDDAKAAMDHCAVNQKIMVNSFNSVFYML